MEEALRATLDDQRLSRGERRALGKLLHGAHDQQLAQYRNLAFKLARAELGDDKRVRNVLGWLEDVVKTLQPRVDDDVRANVYFSPGEQPLQAIINLLSGATGSADICVFTITDDRVSKAIVAAHKRGVAVRIITDNDKAYDRGSDVDRLHDKGIPVRVDRTDAHMHHKFAVFDREVLLTGSYNWTRSACRENHENVLVTSSPKLLAPYCDAFERLWGKLK